MVAAPKRLEQVGIEPLLALANSRHGPGAHAWPSRLARSATHDHLVSAEEARAYFEDEGTAVPAHAPNQAELRALRRLRSATLGLVGPGGTRESARISAPLLSAARFRLDGTGVLHPAQSGWPGFIDSLLPALLELHSLRAQLKICRNSDCRWLYLDRTKNQNRVWCAMAFCGNRAKVSRYMLRRAGG